MVTELPSRPRGTAADSQPPASARVFKASAQADYLPAGIRGFRSAAEGSAGTTLASACDAEGEPHRAAALDQSRDLMPVDVVGVNLGQ